MKRVFEVLAAISFIIMICSAVFCPVGGMNPNNITLYQPWYAPVIGVSFLVMCTCFLGVLVMDERETKRINNN